MIFFPRDNLLRHQNNQQVILASPNRGDGSRFPQLKEINGLFAFLLHFADKTVVDFNLLGAGVAFVFYGFMDDNLLDQGIQQFGSQF